MSFNPTIISYRSQTDHTSHFLNVEDLLRSENYREIKKIYDDLYGSITAYEPSHVKDLIKLEEKFYKRIIELEIEKKGQLDKEGSGWKAIGLSILTFGIRSLVLFIKKEMMASKISGMNKAHLRFSRALTQMEQRSLEKELHHQPEVIKNLEKNRMILIDDELSRLKSIPRVAKSLQKVTGRIQLSKQQQVAYGHSLELYEQVKDTHYVINHGQNLKLMILNIVARKLKEEFEPKQYESFEPLRHDTALRHIKEDIHTVAWYQNLIRKGHTNDHRLQRELLCGDCVLESTTKFESALFFFAVGANVAAYDNPNFISKLLLPVIQDYITNQAVAEKLCSDLVKLLGRCPTGTGNLYSICVPKEKFEESCYFAAPLGIPLDNQDTRREKMEQMQSGSNPRSCPQIRILTHKIRPEDGFHVVLNSTLSTENLKKIDDEVEACIQAALTGYRLQKETEKFPL